MPGPTEILIILLVLVLLFGATRLPQIGKGLGEGIRNFRDAATKRPEIDVTPAPEKDAPRDGSES